MTSGSNEPTPRKKRIKVSYLIKKLTDRLHIDLQPCLPESSWESRYVTEAELHRPGVALAGYVKLFTHQRIQILGNTECKYLQFLPEEKQKEAFSGLFQFKIPIFFLTDSNELPDFLLAIAREAGTPIFKTSLETTSFIYAVRDFLEDQFAMQTLVHGSMVDVYGIGMLITGKSGIGKSEVALDLIERGQRLVADDVVMITKKNNALMASATEMNKHFMEIRGLGIIDIISMFGIRAIRYQKRLEVVLELSIWDETQNIERTGLNHDFSSIIDIDVPLIHLPITPGKNITVIAEVIAMNYLLRHHGYDPAEAFQQKVKKQIARKKTHESYPEPAIDYFEGNTE